MRTCEERTRDVLERRRTVIANRRRRSRHIALGVMCAVVAVGITAHMMPKPNDTMGMTADVPQTYAAYHELYEHIKEQVADNVMLGAVDEIVTDDGELKWYETSQTVNSSNQGDDRGNTNYNGVTRPEHSDTNIQVTGVQEADVVKTDGHYLYALSKATLTIVEVSDGKLNQAAELVLEQDGYAENMYVTDNRLVVERTKVQRGVDVCNTFVEVYDITDRTAPRLLTNFGQSGYRVTSRMIGDILYTVSEYSIYKTPAEDEIATYVPVVSYNTDDVVPLAVKDIYVCGGDAAGCTYTVISGYDTAAMRQVSHKSLLGNGDTVYCSAENLYLAGYTGIKTENSRVNATQLHRFSLKDGEVKWEADGMVEGSLLNQFSMDEHDGYFRLVTTEGGTTWKENDDGRMVTVTPTKTSQSLYVLNDDLEVVGQINNLAPDERVYSVRFTGDIGYFVTFRQTDPLFAVDLSDPTKPTVLSALKIPGFSEYLHPFTDNLLLGLGRDADEKGVQSGNVKLSMFDVSDPADVTEAYTFVLENCQYSAAEHNHKAILADAEHDLIAFPGNAGAYLIYGFTEEDGFALRAELQVPMAEYGRGVYIGDYFYLVTVGYAVHSYRLSDFSLTDTLRLAV